MRYAAIIILLLFSTTMQAQQSAGYTFRYIDQTNGLLHNDVLGIQQDAKGFMWVLTPNGLQRYDGSRFVNYRGMVNDASGGLTNGAELYAQNNSNEIWVLKKNRLEKLNLSSNRLTSADAETFFKTPGLKFDTYTEDENKHWLLGIKGVLLLSADSNRIGSSIVNIRPPQSRQSNFMFKDSLHNETWIIASDSLYLFDGKTKRAFSKKNNSIGNRLLSLFNDSLANPRFLMMDSRGDYWISTWGNLFYRYNRQTGKLFTYNLSSFSRKQPIQSNIDGTLLINAMFLDNHNNLWVATENAGLLLYHKDTDGFEALVVDDRNKQSIQYNFKVNCITQDKDENIWIGTDKGISLFNPYRQYFKSVHHEENTPSLPKNEIVDFIQTKTGSILIGTWGGGISMYDEHWNFKRDIRFTGPHQKNMVWCFVQNDDGNIWAGCQHGYIHIYNPVTETVKTIHPPELATSTIRYMVKDRLGNIWLGLHNGKIAQWNKQQNKFYPYNDSLQTNTTYAGPVFKIFIDKAQHFWVSTEHGFKQFDPVVRRYSRVFLPGNNTGSISAVSSAGIEAVDDSTLAIGTVYGGLNFFNTTTATFSHLTTNEGFPSNTVYAIKKDDAGYLWFTTDYSLYKLNPKNKKVIRYNLEPGTVNASFYNTGFYALKNGTWLTSSTTEIIGFQPKEIIETYKNKKVEIAGFKVFDKPFFIDSLLYQNKPVELSFNQNFFTIEFALLNFSNLQQTKYYYQLSGVNKDWVSAGIKNFAGYTNLAPGKYIFSVKAENDMGMSRPTSFTIIISPPFWQTWWFISLCIIVVVFIVYRLIKAKIKTIRREAGMKQKIAETEMMALRAQMNPHFIFNCLNSIDNLIQMDEKEKATSYLSKFARLIRSILENSKSNVVPCWKDIETLQLYLELEALRFDNKFSYRVNVSDEIMNGDYKVPPLVVQPFVENAIHHGLLNKIEEDKRLLVDISLVNNHIHYQIEDNGVGRAKADSYNRLNGHSHKSMGMQITTERIHLFNQSENGSVKIVDMVNDKQEACGTRVLVDLVNPS